MPKKTLLIGLPILVLTLLIAVTVVLPRLAHVAPIETKAIGVWQETHSRQAYKLTVSRDPDATGRVWYTVTYPRSFLVPFPASLDGDQILIWGENAISDIVWVVTYDAKTDTLTLTRPQGSERHTLKRISA